MQTDIDIQGIFEYLPHRYPFLLIDKVVEMTPGKSLVGIKNVTINEWFFTGHFPNQPIMPGVLVLEALAQASAILGFHSLNEHPEKNNLYLFAGMDNVKFKRVVQPGDQLILKIELLKLRKTFIKVLGTAIVDDNIVCTAELFSMKKGSKSGD